MHATRAQLSLRLQAGTLVCDEPRVCEAFTQHYKALGTAATGAATGEFDEEWRAHVEQKVAEFERAALQHPDTGSLDATITAEEVDAAIKTLKPHKACTQDDFANELFIFGGPAASRALAPVFDLVFRGGAIPPSWREGTIISLHKGGNRQDVSNYRGITILSALGKLYAIVLNRRLVMHLEGELDHPCFLHESQAGFRCGRSCEHHTFTTSQLIQGRLKAGKVTYGLYLDQAKAYDKVWRDGLFFKAHEAGITGRMWLALRAVMAGTTSRVLVGSTLSEPFTRNQGVDQGCNLSTTLFNIYINDLPSTVNTAMQPFITDPALARVSDALFADDYKVLAESEVACQAAVDACRQHARRWRWCANLGVNKTAIVVFSRPRARPPPPRIMWGSTALNVQDSYKHLGVWFTENGSWDKHVDEVLLKAKRRVNQLTKFLTAPALAVPVKRQLIVTCLLPIFDFGSSVWHVSEAQAKALATQYRRAARLVLQCPKSTPIPAIMGDLGLAPLEQRWDLAKLRLQHQILRMSGERHPRIVHDMEWPGSGRHMWPRKLRSIWSALLPGTGNSRRLEMQRLQQLNPKQFIAGVRALWNKREDDRMRPIMREMSKLSLYAQLHAAERQAKRPYKLKKYLSGCLSKAVALKFKLRAGVAELQQEAARRSEGQCPASCPVCPEPVESVVHFLVQCPQYNEERAGLWAALHGVDPVAAAATQQLPVEQQAVALLADTMWPASHTTAASASSIRQVVQDFMLSIMADRQYWVCALAHGR